MFDIFLKYIVVIYRRIVCLNIVFLYSRLLSERLVSEIIVLIVQQVL